MSPTLRLSGTFLVALALGFAAASPTPRSPDFDDDLMDSSLGDMFREVEELMEDTQYKLQNAVKEIEAEKISSDRVAFEDLPPNFHNETITEKKIGNDTILIREQIDKKTDNRTGSTYISVVSELKSGNMDNECIVDEDCRPGNYCHFSDSNYRCLRCKAEETCTRDGECCDGQLCVWGQCKTSSKGESGTICESQRDCELGLCCAVHTSLLFPVCTLMPVKGEVCHTPNPLLDLLSWYMEAEDPVHICPCSHRLVCQPQSDGLPSVCEEPSVQNVKKDPSETLIDDLLLVTPTSQKDMIYEDLGVLPKGFAAVPSDSVDAAESEQKFAPELHLVDYI
ncbi:dickkopf-related protein 3 [Pseudophryne corroboree]|uniref:dickkopf-related protein 3 n=1 Tax=Pseudophryne corroboree TaxID=495146 RepID=UPI003082175E